MHLVKIEVMHISVKGRSREARLCCGYSKLTIEPLGGQINPRGFPTETCIYSEES